MGYNSICLAVCVCKELSRFTYTSLLFTLSKPLTRPYLNIALFGYSCIPLHTFGAEPYTVFWRTVGTVGLEFIGCVRDGRQTPNQLYERYESPPPRVITLE